MSAWQRLSEAEGDEVWDRFYADFHFHPSIHAADFPAIAEPHPSLTFALPRPPGRDTRDGLYHRTWPDQDELDDLVSSVLAAFRACTADDERIYALDWNHPCYWLRPHAAVDEWFVPVLPNGDYYIFLERSFLWGDFGHPWEWTMCVFGADLLAALARRPPLLFRDPIRRS